MDQNKLWEKTQDYQQKELFCSRICYFECIGSLVPSAGYPLKKEFHESEIVNVNLQ